MNYITLKEAAKATGLNEMTIRRLCKKANSKPYVRLREGKNGSLYTIQTNYLFDKYPPKHTPDRVQFDNLDIPVIQDYTPVLAVKDELIQVLKDEITYLREENKGLREENMELKLLPAAYKITQETSEGSKKSFWQRIWGK